MLCWTGPTLSETQSSLPVTVFCTFPSLPTWEFVYICLAALICLITGYQKPLTTQVVHSRISAICFFVTSVLCLCCQINSLEYLFSSQLFEVPSIQKLNRWIIPRKTAIIISNFLTHISPSAFQQLFVLGENI